MRRFFQLVAIRARSSSLGAVITMGNAFAMLIAALATVGICYKVYYDGKINDIKTIMYLQVEQKVDYLSTDWLGKHLATKPLTSFTRQKIPKRYWDCFDISKGYKYYFAQCKNKTLLFYRAPGGKFIVFTAPKKWPIRSSVTGRKAFTITRQGLVLDSVGIKKANVEPREFVQQYIRNSLSTGQLEITTQAGEIIGTFADIPESNAIFFQETVLKSIQQTIWDNSVNLGTYLLVTMFIITLLVSWFSYAQFQPMKKLNTAAHRVGQGDFSVRVFPTGFGEVHQLGHSFREMVQQLKDRDAALAKFHEAAVKSARLESEVDIARNIQESLIPGEKPKFAGLQVAAKYIPASEVGGDWFSYYDLPEQDQFLSVIVDISGHGAGSAIFTAIVAGLFVERVQDADQHLPLQQRALDFLERINALILTIGKGNWHATAQVAIVNRKTKKLVVFNAGHIPPILFSHKENKTKMVTRMGLASSVLGLDQKTDIAKYETEFPDDSVLVMYSDGLTERQSERSNRQLGRKAIAKEVQRVFSRSPDDIVVNLVAKWEEYGGTKEADDDLCLVCLKAA